jgi:hypothetical protein
MNGVAPAGQKAGWAAESYRVRHSNVYVSAAVAGMVERHTASHRFRMNVSDPGQSFREQDLPVAERIRRTFSISRCSLLNHRQFLDRGRNIQVQGNSGESSRLEPANLNWQTGTGERSFAGNDQGAQRDLLDFDRACLYRSAVANEESNLDLAFSNRLLTRSSNCYRSPGERPS